MEKNQKLIFISWIVVSLSVFGSLFFSEIMELPPCKLCWFQRIFMYPIIFIYITGLKYTDEITVIFTLPFISIGWPISVYHNLIQLEIIPESISPCSEGIPCSVKYIEWGGFITIPLLSFFAFSTLGIIAIIILKRSKQKLGQK